MALDGWQERLFRRYLFQVCRPARVERYLNKILSGAERAAPVEERRVTAAALQLELKLFKNPLHYAGEMARRVKEAVAAGAQLVVFPEDNNLQLLGMLPGIEQVGAAAVSEKGAEPSPAPAGPPVTVADVIHYIGPVMEPLIHAVFQARRSTRIT